MTTSRSKRAENDDDYINNNDSSDNSNDHNSNNNNKGDEIKHDVGFAANGAEIQRKYWEMQHAILKEKRVTCRQLQRQPQIYQK